MKDCIGVYIGVYTLGHWPPGGESLRRTGRGVVRVVVEPRKLQRLGSSSLVVTLPREWVKQMGLQPGDMVYLSVEGDSIRITPVNREEIEKNSHVFFDVDSLVKDKEDESLASRAVSCLYILGYDAVSFRVREDDFALQTTIREAAKRLSGLEASETDSDAITIRYILDPSKVNVPTTFRSMGLVVSSLAKLARALLEKAENKTHARLGDARKSLETLRDELFRNQHMVMRYLVSPTPSKKAVLSSSLYSLMIGTSLLGLIGGILVDVVRLLLEREPRRRDVLLEAVSTLEELVPVTTSLLVSPALDRSIEVLKRVEKTMRDVSERVRKCKDNTETIILAYLHQALKILYIISNTILCNALVSSKYFHRD